MSRQVRWQVRRLGAQALWTEVVDKTVDGCGVHRGAQEVHRWIRWICGSPVEMRGLLPSR